MPQYYIDPEKVYSFPNEISIRYQNGTILIIAPETANWIVLSSDKCLEMFEYLGQGNSVGSLVSKHSENLSCAKEVITQIEERHFCNRKVYRSSEEFRSLHIYTTNKCNLNCPHCYMFSGKKAEGELTSEEIIRLFKDYSNIGGKNVTLSGGEPTNRQ